MDLREAAGALGVHHQTACACARASFGPQGRPRLRGQRGDVAALAAWRRLGQEPVRPSHGHHVRDWAARA
jgi:hypothetical protein